MKTFTEYNQQQINEGFWSWLGDLIKSLFDDKDDDDNPITKKLKDKLEDHATGLKQDGIPDKVLVKFKDILKETDPKKFIQLIEQSKTQWINDKLVNNEQAIECVIVLLQMAIAKAEERKDENAVKILTDKLNEYKNKYPKIVDKIDTTSDTVKKKHLQQEEKTKKTLLSIYNLNKKKITEIYTAKQLPITQDNLIKLLSDYCIQYNITDKYIYYSLLLIVIGKLLLNTNTQTQSNNETI